MEVRPLNGILRPTSLDHVREVVRTVLIVHVVYGGAEVGPLSVLDLSVDLCNHTVEGVYTNHVGKKSKDLQRT